MAKWNVNFELTYTYDIKVEADTYNEAVEKASKIYEGVNEEDMICEGSGIYAEIIEEDV